MAFLSERTSPGQTGAKEKLATATMLDGGIARCDECNEIMLEDERHWHVESECRE